ncbi:hypothetical protein [Leptolyngbya ohadii]|uniref:hypothetical protein n=1 Tax=Leptolyngbya ohadii TaxID=1962290 RepID=UPI000B5A1991|nr:hypothetical protein [Leptolyngbya ohadii]
MATNPATNESLDCIEQAVENVTDLPLGWGEQNLTEQMPLNQSSTAPWWLPLWYHVKRLMGWIVSGLAISMGAAFWFEFLSKLINVRNTGKRPDDRTTT